MAVLVARGGRSRSVAGLPRRKATHRFIPPGDHAFAEKARAFARHIKDDPARFALSPDDAERIEQAVIEFRDALAKSLHRPSRSMQMTMRKAEMRMKAEQIVRKYGNLIRLNEQISTADKILVGVRERSKPVRRTKGPMTAPFLYFAGTTGQATMLGHKHILKFWDESSGAVHPRPQGAVRLELFVELVEPDEPIPTHPGELSGGRMWYHRSYTRSPIQVEFPMAKQPMRVVYWARWADAKGNVGPLCQTVKARVEGWDGGGKALPSFMEGRQRQQRVVITSARRALPDYGIKGEQRIEDVSAGTCRLLPAG